MKKQPKQKRSKDIVDAVLDASARILAKLRLKDVSTNKIAEAAGVGIGSLYDYFPNKSSIAVALMDKRIEKLVADFEKLLNSSNQSLDMLIDRSVEFMSENFLDRRSFLREIFLLAPENGRMEALYIARVKASSILEKKLVAHYQKEKGWAERKSFIVIHSVLGFLEGYVMIEDAQFDTEIVKAELKRILTAILEV